MTWLWFFTKTLTTSAANFVTFIVPPFAPVAGLTSHVTIMGLEEKLSKNELSFDEKVETLKFIEWLVDYRNGLALGVITNGIGGIISKGGEETAKIVSSASKESAKVIGHQAAKEIAQNGGKFTPLARQLISNGQQLVKTERIAQKVAEKIAAEASKKVAQEAFKSLITEFSSSLIQLINNREEKSLMDVFFILKGIEDLLDDNLSSQELKNFIKELLKVDRKNTSIYIEWEDNYNLHCKISQNINNLLKKTRSKIE